MDEERQCDEWFDRQFEICEGRTRARRVGRLKVEQEVTSIVIKGLCCCGTRVQRKLCMNMRKSFCEESQQEFRAVDSESSEAEVEQQIWRCDMKGGLQKLGVFRRRWSEACMTSASINDDRNEVESLVCGGRVVVEGESEDMSHGARRGLVRPRPMPTVK
ncbi:hypothetical protein IMY05_C4682000400 [Salix suchowensis]|nr:hypothetical protein IMY05_C4682000400 [Salix suchowensis]